MAFLSADISCKLPRALQADPTSLASSDCCLKAFDFTFGVEAAGLFAARGAAMGLMGAMARRRALVDRRTM